MSETGLRRWARWLLAAWLVVGLAGVVPRVVSADERRTKLQAEMEEAKRRRQEILERILTIGSGADHARREDGTITAGAADLYGARRAEPLADVPEEAFDQGIAAGPWPWSEELLLFEWTLDLDGDGRPEEIRYFHTDTTELLRRHVDRNLDGRIDAWVSYRHGRVFEQDLDDDHDGRRDARERYENDTLVWREVDRDQDGHMDLRRLQRDDGVVEEHFDPDHDGVVVMVVLYRDGVVHERHHDVDGDGVVDVVSFYEEGRLLRREVRSRDVEFDSLLMP